MLKKIIQQHFSKPPWFVREAQPTTPPGYHILGLNPQANCLSGNTG